MTAPNIISSFRATDINAHLIRRSVIKLPEIQKVFYPLTQKILHDKLGLLAYLYNRSPAKIRSHSEKGVCMFPIKLSKEKLGYSHKMCSD